MPRHNEVEWIGSYEEPEVYYEFPAVTLMKGRRSFIFNKSFYGLPHLFDSVYRTTYTWGCGREVLPGVA